MHKKNTIPPPPVSLSWGHPRAVSHWVRGGPPPRCTTRCRCPRGRPSGSSESRCRRRTGRRSASGTRCHRRSGSHCLRCRCTPKASLPLEWDELNGMPPGLRTTKNKTKSLHPLALRPHLFLTTPGGRGGVTFKISKPLTHHTIAFLGGGGSLSTLVKPVSHSQKKKPVTQYPPRGVGSLQILATFPIKA